MVNRRRDRPFRRLVRPASRGHRPRDCSEGRQLLGVPEGQEGRSYPAGLRVPGPRADLLAVADPHVAHWYRASVEELAGQRLPLEPGILPALWLRRFDDLELTLEREPEAIAERDQIACRLGCTYCCRQPVGGHALGVFLIARTIIQAPPSRQRLLLERLIRSISATDPLDGEALACSGLACPFLAGDRICGIHRVRPIACRNSLSRDAQGCAVAFEAMRDSGQPTPFPAIKASWYAQGTAHLRAAWLLSAHLRLADGLYELARAVRIALAEPEAERRWLDGEDVLGPASMFRRFPRFIFGDSNGPNPRGFAIEVRDGAVIPIGPRRAKP